MKTHLFSEFNPTSKEEWIAAIHKELKGQPFDSLIWKTKEGVEVSPFYTAEDVVPVPSKYTFRTNNEWEIRENIVADNFKKSNKDALEALNQGATSLHFILNKEVNKKNLEFLLKDILPEHISIHFSCEGNPLGVLDWVKHFVGEKNPKIKGSVIFNPFADIDQTAGMVTALSGFSPFFRCITVPQSDATLITGQLSKALYNGHIILKQLLERNIPVDEIAARIQFSFPVSNNYFFEIAKFRAMRILWAKLMEQQKPLHDCSLVTFIHAEINPLPGNSIQPQKFSPLKEELGDGITFISNTSRAMSAAIGGADSISIDAHNPVAKKINRNIQLLLKEESQLIKMGDVSQGSYYIELLTGKMVENVWEVFQKNA